MTSPCLFGLFVGGRGRRLGGVVKGSLLTDEGRPLWEGLHRSISEAHPEAEVWLVGDGLPQAEGTLPRLFDDPPGRGPLGGLAALLKRAHSEGCQAVALASDLPRVSAQLLTRLLTEEPDAALYAPRIDGIYQPLFARYEPRVILSHVEAILLTPRASLLSIFERAPVMEMTIDASEREALLDWDEPLDLPPHLRGQLPRRDD